MSYPGNASLAAEIQARILQTYDQTLDLAAAGALTEAQAGCDFILKLDPLFERARTLKDRLADTEGTEGAVAVDDLRLSDGAPSSSAADLGEDSGDLFEAVTGVDSDPSESFGDVFPTQPTAEETPELALDSDLASALDLTGLKESAPAVGPAGDSGITPPSGPETSEVAGLDSALDLSSLSGGPAIPAIEPPQAAEPAEPAEPARASIPEPEAPALVEEPLDALGGGSSPELDSESEQRVETLLSEGQLAFEERDYQSAIDAWSRIFLVDIDHPEANRRIELARKLKDEVERQVEERYHETVSKVEAGDLDGARAGFNAVLEMQPTHLAAQEYLEKLDSSVSDSPAAAVSPPLEASRDATTAPKEPTPEKPADSPDTLEMAVDSLQVPSFEGDFPTPGGDKPGVDIPPPPRERATQSEGSKSPSKGGIRGIRPSFLYIGGAVLLLVAVGAWLLLRNWDTTFPNATADTPRVERPQVDPIARAQQLHSQGNTPLAIAQLRRVAPNHPLHAQAQELISQWEPPGDEDGEKPADDPEFSADQEAERDRLITEARAAFDRKEFFSAEVLLTQAAATAKLDDETLALRQAAAIELEPLRSTIEIFRQGEWAEALRGLWQFHEADPDNPDVRGLIVDSYYNLGVRALQRGDPVEAAEHFGEALLINDVDFEVQRAALFTESYSQRTPDLLYRIFVKYLPFR